LLKVVATIDSPASHHGTARPDTKNSDVLRPARLPKNSAGTKQINRQIAAMTQSRDVRCMRRSDYTGDGEILANRDRQTAGGTVVWARREILTQHSKLSGRETSRDERPGRRKVKSDRVLPLRRQSQEVASRLNSRPLGGRDDERGSSIRSSARHRLRAGGIRRVSLRPGRPADWPARRVHDRSAEPDRALLPRRTSARPPPRTQDDSVRPGAARSGTSHRPADRSTARGIDSAHDSLTGSASR